MTPSGSPALLLPTPPSQFANGGAGRMRYVELGTGDPVIFLHGGGPGCSGWSDFRLNASRFSERFRCIFVDLLQFGWSDTPRISGPNLTFHAESLVRFMDDLGLRSASFVCQSFGGSVALRLAIDAPERVRRIVLTGSQPMQGVYQPLRMREPEGVHIVPSYFADPSPAAMEHLMARYCWYRPEAIDEPIRTQIIEERFEMSTRSQVLDLVRNTNWRGMPQHLEGELDGNHAPTLIVWGQHDWWGGLDVPLYMMQRMQEAYIYVLPACGHYLQQERPEMYARLAIDFLEQ